MKNKFFFLSGFLVLLTLLVPMLLSAQATTYSYTGNAFTSGSLIGQKITGYFTVDTPLTSTSIVFIFPTFYSFNVGTVIFDSTNSSNYESRVAVDASGNITSWNFWMVKSGVDSSIFTRTTSGPLDGLTSPLGNGYISSNPGTWTAVAVPEPATALLVASGTALTVFLRKRLKT